MFFRFFQMRDYAKGYFYLVMVDAASATVTRSPTAEEQDARLQVRRRIDEIGAIIASRSEGDGKAWKRCLSRKAARMMCLPPGPFASAMTKAFLYLAPMGRTVSADDLIQTESRIKMMVAVVARFGQEGWMK